jgi:hypothetical protein
MTAPLTPDRLRRLLDDAVRPVTPGPGALDRIRRGVRRRRAVRRAGALLAAAALIVGGGLTAQALARGAPPRGAASKAAPPPRLSPASGSAPHVPSPAVVPERTAIVPVGDAATTTRFLLVAHIAGPGPQAVPFTAASAAIMPPSGPVIIGAADAAGDGHAEIFVQVGRGCCADFWTIFRLVDGHLRQVSLYGRPVELAVGGSAAMGGGFSCPDHDLVAYGYLGEKAGTFLVTRTTYRWAGATLMLVSRQQATVRAPGLAGYRAVSCGDLTLGGS